MSYANNKGADQPAHLRSLISTFFHYLDSMVCILAVPNVSRFLLASVAEQHGLFLPGQKSPKTHFRVMWLMWLILSSLLNINYLFSSFVCCVLLVFTCSDAIQRRQVVAGWLLTWEEY